MSKSTSQLNEKFSELYSRAEYSEVIRIFEKANVDGVFDEVSFTIVAASYYQERKLDSAIKFYTKALKLNSYSSEAKNNLAVIYMEQSDHASAENIFLNLIKEEPSKIDPIINLANLYCETMSYEKAVLYYRKALSLKPDNIILQTRLSEILFVLGHYDESIDTCNSVINLEENNYEAYYQLGRCYFEISNFEDAKNNFLKCIKLKPEHALAIQNLGTCFFKLGDTTQALRLYDEALALDPTNAQLFVNRGLVFFELAAVQDAASAFSKALEIDTENELIKEYLLEAISGGDTANLDSYKKYFVNYFPENVKALELLSNFFIKIEHFERAIDMRRSLVVREPDNAHYLFILAHAHDISGDKIAAFELYKKAVEINPTMSGAYYNMALISTSWDDYVKAEKFYLLALDAEPTYEAAMSNLALLYQKLGDLNQALDLFEKVLSLNKNNFTAMYNMTGTLTEMRKYEEAKKVLYSMLEHPEVLDKSGVHNSLGNIFNHFGDRSNAISHFEAALSEDPDSNEVTYNLVYNLANACDWKKLDSFKDTISRLGLVDGIFSPFGFWQFEDLPKAHLERAKKYTKRKYTFKNAEEFSFTKKRNGKINIGFFSADFRMHPVTFLSIRMLELLDRDRFKVIGYCIGPDAPSEMRTAAINACDVFRTVREIPDAEVVSLARRDELDIAVDLTGYTDNDRASLFSQRVAPIQINFLGYPGTTGSEFMDYIICDQHVVPKEFSEFYTETKIYMPDVYMPTDNTRPRGKNKFERGDFDLPEKSIILCCFNNNYKITKEVFECWCGILRRNTDTVLWIKSSNSEAQNNMKVTASELGIDNRRLIFAGFVEKEEEHIARQSLADLFLDTFNFNAHTTATEALWAGVPLVTKTGKSFAARVSGSLLYSVGLDELVTASKQEYVEKIEFLIQNPEYLKNLKNKLKKNLETTPLFNSELYTKNFERGLIKTLDNLHNNKKEDIFV